MPPVYGPNADGAVELYLGCPVGGVHYLRVTAHA